MANTTHDLVMRLVAAFPQTPMREHTEAIYTSRLSDLDTGSMSRAVDELIATSTTFPTIAEVRNLVAEAMLELPTPEQAYASIMERKDEVHDLTRRVGEIFGGFYNLRTSESPSITRAQFLKTYGEIRSEEIRKANLTQLRVAA
jgi:hypothetical protein